jgi:acyl-coenzyme A synthetase/AMP-(fatty) acid ligase
MEETLRAEPSVKDAVVIPVPSASGNVKLHAYLIPNDRAEAESVDLRALLSRCNSRLARHQRVGTASWWAEEDFPRTSGLLKIRRHLLPVPDKATMAKFAKAGASDSSDESDEMVAGAV